MEIRRERPTDHAAISSLHHAAFAPPGFAADEVPEVVLVDRLRAGPWWIPELSLVAMSGQAVVGHVVASRAAVEPSGAPVLGLGPLGVLPAAQGRGVGSALMHAVLGAAEARGERLVGVLGNPAFYRRFGFVPAVEHGVIPPDPTWAVGFQVRVLSEPVPTGTFRYAEPFDQL